MRSPYLFAHRVVGVALIMFAAAMCLPAASAAQVPTYLTTWGSRGSGDGQFLNPTGITIDRFGVLYVVDTGNARVQKFNRDGAFLGSWLLPAVEPNEQNLPYDIACDAFGHVFVINEGSLHVQKFTTDGALLMQWGYSGSGPGQFIDPISIACDDVGNVYVGVLGTREIKKFTGDSVFVARWGTHDETLGLCVSPQGVVYAAQYAGSVQAFSTSGAPLFTWGTEGADPGQFRGSTRVTTDREGHVYVSDSNNQRIQMFTAAGAYLGQWGTGGQENLPGVFAFPFGIACDPDGNVYVVDSSNPRIQKFGHAVVAAKQQSWGGLKALYR
jgi:DNA-binding beta-propeller fold protein YncE